VGRKNANLEKNLEGKKKRFKKGEEIRGMNGGRLTQKGLKKSLFRLVWLESDGTLALGIEKREKKKELFKKKMGGKDEGGGTTKKGRVITNATM